MNKELAEELIQILRGYTDFRNTHLAARVYAAVTGKWEVVPHSGWNWALKPIGGGAIKSVPDLLSSQDAIDQLEKRVLDKGARVSVAYPINGGAFEGIRDDQQCSVALHLNKGRIITDKHLSVYNARLIVLIRAMQELRPC